MITGIRGKVQQLSENNLTLDVDGIFYEIHIPTAVMRGFDGRLGRGSSVELVTYHYHQTDPSKSIPMLIGFANQIEKDFFEKFITVSGVGPKAAVRALKEPIPDIAQAIDGGDLKFLKSLPGIGEQRAKEIIAKLQGKMGKFGLIQTQKNGAAKEPSSDLKEEALEVLAQLQYKREEAKEMIRKAFMRKPNLSGVEEILNEVYRQRKEK